jgi:hypothetical protein
MITVILHECETSMLPWEKDTAQENLKWAYQERLYLQLQKLK